MWPETRGAPSPTMDDNNKDLVTPEMKAAVDAAAEKIKSGEIQVHDYMADNSCPVE